MSEDWLMQGYIVRQIYTKLYTIQSILTKKDEAYTLSILKEKVDKFFFLSHNDYFCDEGKLRYCMRKITLPTLFFFLTTLILAVLLLVNNRGGEKERGYDSTAVMTRISHIRELALVKHNYTGVIGYKDYKKFLNMNIPLTDKYFLLKYNGYIKAGVDFDRIKVKVENDTTLHVSIPKPRVLDTVIDEKSVEVYNESENAFNPIKIADYNEALIREKNVMINDAINQGILADATEQTKLVLITLLQEMGFTRIKITEELATPSVD